MILIRIPVHLFKLLAGIFIPSKNLSLLLQIGQVLSRITWEFPQVMLGLILTIIFILIGITKSVQFAFGSTVVQTKFRYGGFTLGHIIVGDQTIKADPYKGLFQHEYGHVIQSRISGFIYLAKYALPSLISSWRYEPTQHDKHPVEQDANIRSNYFFSEQIGLSNCWNEKYNPVFQEIIPEPLKWFDFLPVYFPFVHLYKAFRK